MAADPVSKAQGPGGRNLGLPGQLIRGLLGTAWGLREGTVSEQSHTLSQTMVTTLPSPSRRGTSGEQIPGGWRAPAFVQSLPRARGQHP